MFAFEFYLISMIEMEEIISKFKKSTEYTKKGKSAKK